MRPDFRTVAAFCGALLIPVPALSGPVSPVFSPVSVPAHVYAGGWEHFVGGGIAAFDCDGDHLPELYAAGGSNPGVLLRNRSGDSDGVRFQADTPAALRLTGVIGAYALDIDSDGHPDLAILRAGENLLLRGGPDCRFAPFDGIGFVSGDRWTTAFSATWEQAQTLPTLGFGNYVDRTDPDGPFRACDHNFLYRPDAGRYRDPLALKPGFCPLSMLFSDWGRTGRADLRISNDRHYYVDDGQEQLWSMQAEPRLYSSTDGWQDHKLWGMGIAARDIDRDGQQEVFLTSMGDQRLQRRAPDAGGPHYTDAPYDMGTTAHRPFMGGDGRPSTGWHAAFGDVQNDGRDDLFIAKGNVEQMPDAAMDDPNNLLVQGADGRFVEMGDVAGVASLHRSRGAALADFDGDGRLDLAVVNRRAPMQVWRNETPLTGHWLAVSPVRPAPNVNAVGGWVELDDGTGQPRLREITVGGGHAGGVAGPQHFGLGDATTVRLRMIWPDGSVSDWVETATDRHVTVRPETVGDGLVIKQ